MNPCPNADSASWLSYLIVRNWPGLIVGWAMLPVFLVGCATRRPDTAVSLNQSTAVVAAKINSNSVASIRFISANVPETRVAYNGMCPATDGSAFATVPAVMSLPMNSLSSQPIYEPFTFDGGYSGMGYPCPSHYAPCPSYCPDCGCELPRLNFCDDLHELPKRFGNDLQTLVTWDNAIVLGATAGVTIAIRDNVDGRVIHDNELHAKRWNKFSEVLSHGGDPFLVHAPLLGGMYLTSLYQQNEDLHQLTLTMFTSYKFAVFGSLALQYATGTRTTDGEFFELFKDSGFPSEATAGSFALAAVAEERYGWTVGLPAYIFSGLIGFARVDQNDNRVSDVVFGAVLGYVIGKSIGSEVYRPHDPFKLVPFVDGATGAQGMGFEYRY